MGCPHIQRQRLFVEQVDSHTESNLKSACYCRLQVKVDSEEHLRKVGGRLRWAQLRRWLEKRAGGFETLTLRCVTSFLGDTLYSMEDPRDTALAAPSIATSLLQNQMRCQGTSARGCYVHLFAFVGYKRQEVHVIGRAS